MLLMRGRCYCRCAGEGMSRTGSADGERGVEDVRERGENGFGG